MNTETTTAKKDKRYNITGVIANLIVRGDKNKAPYATLELKREGKKTVKAVAFGEKATQLTSQFQNGSVAKLFGFFEKRTYQGQDGSDKSAQRFQVLWSGEPRPAKEEAPAEAAETANAFA